MLRTIVMLCISLGLGLTTSMAQPVSATWAQRVGERTQHETRANDLATDGQENVFAVFQFGDSITVDPIGINAFYQDFDPNGPSTQHSLLVKYDATGQHQWHQAWLRTRMSDVEVGPGGNVYVLVRHKAGFDLDPGADTVMASQGGLALVKLSNQGAYLWHYSISGAWYAQIGLQAGIHLAGDGALYLKSTFPPNSPAPVDFDPGPGVVTLQSNFANRGFLVKLDTAGQFHWARQTGGILRFPKAMVTSGPNGKLYLLGEYLEGSDLDPGPGIYSLGEPTSTHGMFVQCLDSMGHFVWAKGFSNPNPTQSNQPIFPYGLASDSLGHVYVVGGFEEQIDFDPDSGSTHTLAASVGTIDAFVLKLGGNGNLLWAKAYGGSNGKHAAHVATIGPDQHVYIQGVFQGQMDLDPGPGTVPLSNSGSFGQYVQKLSPEGYLVWGHNVMTGATNGQVPLVAMTVSHSEKVLFAGPYWDTSSDFDPGAGQLTLANDDPYVNLFISAWSQDSCATLGLGIDSLTAVSCTSGSGFVVGAVSGGISPHTYIWETTPLTFGAGLTVDSAGLYTLRVADANGCSRETQVWIDGPMSGSGFDLRTNLVATQDIRAGFGTILTLDAYNQGCTPITGTLRFVLDIDVTLDSVQPAPTQIVGDTLFWDFANLTFDSGHLVKRVYLTADSNLNIGHPLCFSTTISPIPGDAVPANNDRHYCFQVVGSYDPNDKQVYPRGVCEEGFVAQDQVLTYTVRFQNTGNAEAIFVVIDDTLSQALDPNSIQVVAQSHAPMSTQIVEDNLLRFRFDDIMLPDSASDPEGSIGYVVFELTPKENLPDGTPVTNRAAIYFDFNEPIITNSVRNTLVEDVPGPELTPEATAVSQMGNELTALAEGFAYQWLVCEGTSFMALSGETNSRFVATTSGSYALMVSNGACSDTSVCFSVDVTQVSDVLPSQPSIFPNPSTGRLWINFGDAPHAFSATLYDALGQAVQRHQTNASRRYELTLPPTPGVYLLQVQTSTEVYRYRIWRL